MMIHREKEKQGMIRMMTMMQLLKMQWSTKNNKETEKMTTNLVV